MTRHTARKALAMAAAVGGLMMGGVRRYGAQGDSGCVAGRLGGVTDKDAELLAEAFNIKTVRQLGANKFFAVAAALVAVENAG